MSETASAPTAAARAASRAARRPQPPAPRPGRGRAGGCIWVPCGDPSATAVGCALPARLCPFLGYFLLLSELSGFGPRSETECLKACKPVSSVIWRDAEPMASGVDWAGWSLASPWLGFRWCPEEDSFEKGDGPPLPRCNGFWNLHADLEDRKGFQSHTPSPLISYCGEGTSVA